MTPLDTREGGGSTAKGKEIHRRVMLALGGWITLAGLAAGYLALSGGGGLPSIMYGRLRPASPPASPIVRRAGQPLVAWRDWSPGVLKEASKSDRLILLDLSAAWSRASHVMDETTYADPAAAGFIARSFVAVRVDADARPDLALRYLAAGWPTTALLLPTGEILGSGTLMAPALFQSWALAIETSFRKRRAAVQEAAERTAAKRKQEQEKALRASAPAALTLRAAREILLSRWDDATSGFGPAPRFPCFRRIRLLGLLDEPWASDLAKKAAAGALQLEDRVWGGFYRYAEGPGWQNPEHEKTLEDQAEAIEGLASIDPKAALRALAFVETFLSDPRGGYASSQGPELKRADGRVIEGGYYFSLPDEKRRALGLPPVDRRIFARPNALLARAVLDSRRELGGAGQEHALRALERIWKEGVSQPEGLIRHGLSPGPIGLLEDQTALAEAFLAAYEATGQRRNLERAVSLARAMERLLDPRSQALFDRPATGELPEDLDRMLVPHQNFEALLAYRRLARALPPGDPVRERFQGRAAALESWLKSHSAGLDPAELALLASGKL